MNQPSLRDLRSIAPAALKRRAIFSFKLSLRDKLADPSQGLPVPDFYLVLPNYARLESRCKILPGDAPMQFMRDSALGLCPKGTMGIIGSGVSTPGNRIWIVNVPKGRLIITHVLCEFLSPLRIQHQRAPTFHHRCAQAKTLAVSGRHRAKEQNEAQLKLAASEDHVHILLSLRLSTVSAAKADDRADQGRFVKMGA